MDYLTPKVCVFKTPLAALKKERDRNRRDMRRQQLLALLCREPDLEARRAYELFEETDRYQGLSKDFDEWLERHANADEELLRELSVGQFPVRAAVESAMNRTVPHPSQTKLRRAEEFTWGPRPTTAPNSSSPKMRLREWRPVRKGKLLGFATVELTNGLVICDAPVMAGDGGPWATLPAKPELDREGRRKLDADGKPSYAPVLWRSRDLADEFSAAVVSLLRAAHPEALGDGWPS